MRWSRSSLKPTNLADGVVLHASICTNSPWTDLGKLAEGPVLIQDLASVPSFPYSEGALLHAPLQMPAPLQVHASLMI